MLNIILFGSGGQLGAEFVSRMKKQHKLSIFNRSDCDIADYKKVRQSVLRIQPDIILNCAAYTNVDGAEKDFSNSNIVNNLALENLSNVANESNSTLVHFSTDYVFDSTSIIPIKENHPKSPLNQYGLSKHLGEEKIKTICNKFFIFRVGWVYGKNGDNFPKKIIDLAKKNTEIKVIDDQIGVPTPTSFIVEVVKELLNDNNKLSKYGVYNISPNGIASWYEVALIIKNRIDGMRNDDFKLKKIIPVKSSEFKSLAKRPKYSCLCNEKIKNMFKINPLHWEIYLDSFLDEILI